jgi:hypothetical protein
MDKKDYIAVALAEATNHGSRETYEDCEIYLGDLAMGQAIEKALQDGDTSAIAELVRTGVVLGVDGRELLAGWVAGKYRRGKGRPPDLARKHLLASGERAVRNLHRERNAGGGRLSLEMACDEIAERYGLLPQQLRDYVRRGQPQKMH